MHCKRCKNKVSQYAKMCPYCHARLDRNERATRQYMEMLTENKFTRSKNGRKFEKKMGVALVSIFVVVSILLISYKDQSSQWQIGDQTVFYMQEDQLFGKNLKNGDKKRIVDLSQENEEEKQVVSAQSQTFHYNKSNRRIYYAKGITSEEEQLTYSIYERKVDKWASAPERIAEEVRLTFWDSHETVYYCAGESKMLYKYDGIESTSIQLPLVKEVREVTGTGNLFVIAYQPRHDKSCYDYTTYDETDGLLFYLVDTKTFKARRLFHRRIESYAYTADGTHLYYQVDNVLYEYDLVRQKETVFEKNVYEFMLVSENEVEKLYYISYGVEKKSLYDFVKDPYLKQDQTIEKNKTQLAKEGKKDKENRLSRNQFRKQLKEEALYLFEGSLYQYKLGKKELVEEQISMLDSQYKSMAAYEPFIYKQKEIGFGSYELKKEGMEEIGSVYDMVVNLIDGQIRNYDINYESLSVYEGEDKTPQKYDVLMCCEDTPFKVKEDKLKVYDADDSEEEEARSSVYTDGRITYYVSWYHDYALYQEENGKNRELVKSVQEYKVLEDGTVLALSYDENKGNYTLYQIKDGSKSIVDTKVTAIAGNDVLLSKAWE